MIKLFCIPYAGGSSNIFLRWNKLIHSNIKIIPIELAGRGIRISESFYTTMDEASTDIYNIITKSISPNEPYAILGHSMGSYLVFEASHKIQKSKLPMPKHIFFSGQAAPHTKSFAKKRHTLSNQEFKKEILDLGGTPKELLENKELFDFFLPIIKADFTILENYNYQPSNLKLNCNISIFNGKLDNISTYEINAWKEHTSCNCNIYNFNGGHFFINENSSDVVEKIEAILQ